MALQQLIDRIRIAVSRSNQQLVRLRVAGPN